MVKLRLVYVGGRTSWYLAPEGSTFKLAPMRNVGMDENPLFPLFRPVFLP